VRTEVENAGQIVTMQTGEPKQPAAANVQTADLVRGSMTPEPPAGDDARAGCGETIAADSLDNLAPAVKKAWASWKLAETNHTEKPQDRAAYDWLAEQEDDFFVGELRTPCFRYLVFLCAKRSRRDW